MVTKAKVFYVRNGYVVGDDGYASKIKLEDAINQFYVSEEFVNCKVKSVKTCASGRMDHHVTVIITYTYKIFENN